MADTLLGPKSSSIQTSIDVSGDGEGTRVDLRYVAEGGANIIYEVHALPTQVVLRLRKDIPSAFSVTQAVRNFRDHIEPLFSSHPGYLLQPTLVSLPPECVDDLNEALREMEKGGRRPPGRHGKYLPSYTAEPCGVLMENLAVYQYHRYGTVGQPGGIDAPDAGFYLIEFKPKWMDRSMRIPQNARNCRTCALADKRAADEDYDHRGSAGFCPFDLLSCDRKTLRSSLRHLCPNPEDINHFISLFVLKVQPVLRTVQLAQERFSITGLSAFENPSEADRQALPVAMALRDCSIFMRVKSPAKHNGSDGLSDIETVKVGDLDLKDASNHKLEKWADIERDLIEEGWYAGQHVRPDNPVLHQPRLESDRCLRVSRISP